MLDYLDFAVTIILSGETSPFRSTFRLLRVIFVGFLCSFFSVALELTLRWFDRLELGFEKFAEHIMRMGIDRRRRSWLFVLCSGGPRHDC